NADLGNDDMKFLAQAPHVRKLVGLGLSGNRISDDGVAALAGAPIPLPDYGNLHGRPRMSCLLCGECDVGCNYGSKNTLDHTYLSAAKHAGADIRTLHEVRAVTPLAGGGYEVGYVVHQPDVQAAVATLEQRTITCDRLVLGAGTLGTTFLLLRNRAALPGLSRRLGHRFSGNGDLLGFMLGAPLPPLGSAHAPVITTAVRVPDAADGAQGRGFYVEDAGYPGFTEWLVEAVSVGGQARRLVAAGLRLVREHLTHHTDHEIGDVVSDLLGTGAKSAGAMPMLAMGRDIPDGLMSVEDDHLQIDHYPRSSQEYFAHVGEVMAALVKEMGGHFDENPLTRLSRVVTVHPLGGASMGADATTGVVDAWGEVFEHPGLYVADGAAMPGPVGANPSLTIAAFAERLAEHVLEGAS
ncbi:MAG: GMC family oxidoreductase, partial [Actinomycetes bacterium]